MADPPSLPPPPGPIQPDPAGPPPASSPTWGQPPAPGGAGGTLGQPPPAWGAAGPPPAAPPRWGMGEAALGLVLANVFALVGGAVILVATGNLEAAADGELSLGITALLQVPLWTGYLGVPLWVARYRGDGVRRTFGFTMRPSDVPIGIGAGLVTQLLLIPLLYVPIFLLFGDQDLSSAARELTDKATDPVGVVLLVLIVAIGAPIIEELFFRGLLQGSVQRRFGTVVAVAASSLVFGLVHFQLLQLPALVLFGLVAALLTVWKGRLGPAIWAHIAFNATAVAILVVGG